MKKKTPLALWLIGFILLSLYINLIPRFFDAGNVPLWFAYWAGFFVLAFMVSRFLLQLQGLKQLGMARHKGWLLHLGIGFLVGFLVYALKYLAFYELGKFEVAGLMEPGFILPMLGQALLAMFFSSILNDITIRGYWFAYFKRRQLLAWYVFAATILYTLDDFWNEGLDPLNFVFSAILGAAFAYTVLKTGAIWISLGLHWGGNMMYRVMYGFDGNGVWQLENVQEGPLYDYISLGVTVLMLPAVYFILKSSEKHAPTPELRVEEGQVV
ncbi:CPBP family intramembrane glutamic endopeptidase [Pontibacter anaerobius]|uniref:CPBP family intramembrane metalloprotease n=1 Tax=Pontibacter anaerobius TaxID=2993940 RepID=A0ABT3RFR5_9BACT|nr:CPBP family intramembrane glutamic endopeptidase [Pontibacter anaerobius]MCX2740197.1 CPBP family intramembrane metalloprotease [Pontibacter anaerobius]